MFPLNVIDIALYRFYVNLYLEGELAANYYLYTLYFTLRVALSLQSLKFTHMQLFSIEFESTYLSKVTINRENENY